ncbi:hypothetical protein [Terriglobus sp.]|uniref:hypothetical protein n=1 Tax=Terriglobus sp. TaxID=1889013 RepID=UPI003B00F41B
MSQADEVQAALNRFYATEPACVWTNSVTLEHSKGRSKSVTAEEARALDQAGLIDVQRHSYKLTNAGRAFWRDDKTEQGFGNLCFGKWHVDRIVSMTTRPDDLFGNATEVQFDATVASPALWTRSPAMQKAFPLMALEVSRPLPHSATMKHTDKGWQIAVIAVPSVP